MLDVTREYLEKNVKARVHVEAKSFTSRNNTYWNGRGKSDKEGLVLLDEAITNLSANGNWDPLSRFVSRAAALNAQDRSKVMAVIRAAFGDQIIDENTDIGLIAS